MTLQSQLKDLVKMFEANAHTPDAEQMTRYMKFKFPFLGLKSPLRNRLQKEFIAASRNFSNAEVIRSSEYLWEKDEREFQYVACDLLRRRSKKLQRSNIGFLERLVQKKAWWDTVDSLAGTIGDFFLVNKDLQPSQSDVWIEHPDMWLQRVAIIHQLKYKDNTDWDMLQRYIRKVADSEEFFLQKAAGWALRQYSKFHPDLVREFVATQALKPLTVREASKYLTPP